MGLFDFFKKPKNMMEEYYEERNKREAANQQAEDFQYNPIGQQDFSEFRITVEDVFTITGRGTVITGQVESGEVRVGDTLRIQRVNGQIGTTVVTGIEQFRKMLDYAKTGDNVGMLLRDVTKNDIGKGDVLTKN